jgi:hypothetical protein
MKQVSSALPDWRRPVGTFPSRRLCLVTLHRSQTDGPEGITDFTMLDTGSAHFVPSSNDVKLTVITEASVLYTPLESLQ